MSESGRRAVPRAPPAPDDPPLGQQIANVADCVGGAYELFPRTMDLPPPVYAETEVVEYTLPALGDREAMLGALARHEYGIVPAFDFAVGVEPLESGPLAGNPAVRREQWEVSIETNRGRVDFVIAVFLPAEAARPVPVFLGLNFYGNHTVHADPALLVTKSWCRPSTEHGVVDNHATEAGRGTSASRWPIDLITKRGYGVATIYCGDLAPDDAAHWKGGVAKLWQGLESEAPPGAIASWAWGLSRAREALAVHDAIDRARIIAIGHSRLGKTALWAGARDTGFAAVISNDSGCGGAALSRRRIGERLIHINTRFPHWFTLAFHDYNERELELPIDQHQLLAAIAPRPLYVASAQDDRWADPRGEYLALVAAAPAWGETLPPEPPPVNEVRISGSLAYHIRTGPHDITAFDWERYLDFSDMVLAGP